MAKSKPSTACYETWWGKALIALSTPAFFFLVWWYVDSMIVKPLAQVNDHTAQIAVLNKIPEDVEKIEKAANEKLNAQEKLVTDGLAAQEQRLVRIEQKFDKQIEQTAPLVTLTQEIQTAAKNFDATARTTNDALKNSAAVAKDVAEIKTQVAEVKNKLKDLETVATNVKAASEAIAKIDTAIQQINNAEPTRTPVTIALQLAKTDKFSEDGKFRTLRYVVTGKDLPESVANSRFDQIRIEGLEFRPSFSKIGAMAWECQVDASDRALVILISTLPKDVDSVSEFISRPETQAVITISRPVP